MRPLATVSAGRFSAAVSVSGRLTLSSVVRDGRQLLAPQGAPLMTPWFGRLPGLEYRWGGASVTLSPEDPRVERDESGRPLHGLLCEPAQWHLVQVRPDSVTLRSEDLSCAAFPFPFTHRVTVSASDAGVSVSTTLVAGRGGCVPVAFGWHPYFLLPAARSSLPVPVASGTLRTRLLLEGSLPSGAREEMAGGGLDGAMDDFWECAGGGSVQVAGAAGPVSLSWDDGFGWAVTWGPADAAFVCVEPLAGPLDPFSASSGPRILPPGGEHQATFSIF